MKAKRPLNAQAVQEANKKLWGKHKDLGGRQLTMKGDPSETALRQEWMREYQKALLDLEKKPPTSGQGPVGEPSKGCGSSPGKVGEGVEECEPGAVLIVRVLDQRTSERIEKTTVTLFQGGLLYDQLATDGLGEARFESVREGAYRVEALKEDYTVGETAAEISPGTMSEKEVPITREESGISTSRCILAQESDEKIRETVETVQKLRVWAGKAGYTMALAALDHFLDGSGTWVEIPADIMENTTKQSWKAHREKTISKVNAGSMSMLARHHLMMNGPKKVPRYDRAKPVAGWPAEVDIKMEWISGSTTLWKTDENLAYNGPTIRSQVVIRCVKTSDNAREYRCRFESWSAYVYDNYDWDYADGDKKAAPGWPWQSEMDELTKVGCAKSYQRSSEAWEAPVDDLKPWTVAFDSEEDAKQAAESRWVQDELERAPKQATELSMGALPIPKPANEMR